MKPTTKYLAAKATAKPTKKPGMKTMLDTAPGSEDAGGKLRHLWAGRQRAVPAQGHGYCKAIWLADAGPGLLHAQVSGRARSGQERDGAAAFPDAPAGGQGGRGKLSQHSLYGCDRERHYRPVWLRGPGQRQQVCRQRPGPCGDDDRQSALVCPGAECGAQGFCHREKKVNGPLAWPADFFIVRIMRLAALILIG